MADRPFIPDRFRPVIARLEDALDAEAAATVPDLPAYLEARWAEEEAAALAADVRQGDPQWKVSPVLAAPGHYTVRSAGSNRPIARVEDVGDDDPDDPASGPQSILVGADVATHIAYWDPARVLSDLTAKRALLAWLTHDGHRATNNWDTAQFKCSTLDDPADDCDCGHDQTVTTILAPFAQAYTARPDFPEEWRG